MVDFVEEQHGLMAPPDHLEHAHAEQVTLNIASEHKSIRAQFVHNITSNVVRYLLLGHCTLVTLAAIFGLLSLLHDLIVAAVITLLYSFVTATFAQHTSIDFTIENESRAARFVSSYIWMSVYSIEFYFLNQAHPIGSFILTFFSTVFAVFSQAALLFLTQALFGNRIETFEINDRLSAVTFITASIATFYLCMLLTVLFSRIQ